MSQRAGSRTAQGQSKIPVGKPPGEIDTSEQDVGEPQGAMDQILAKLTELETNMGCIPNAVLRTSANSHGWFLQVCQCTIQVDEERKVTCGLLCDLSCA